LIIREITPVNFSYKILNKVATSGPEGENITEKEEFLEPMNSGQ